LAAANRDLNPIRIARRRRGTAPRYSAKWPVKAWEVAGRGFHVSAALSSRDRIRHSCGIVQINKPGLRFMGFGISASSMPGCHQWTFDTAEVR